ncbi:MAG: hypothetical protein CM15mP55_3540 [Hyphomicrobiales bacterium]|nr:MAG: hypothetical protein CM15mP55_3540 [Hyphomicrobiales bacterium]
MKRAFIQCQINIIQNVWPTIIIQGDILQPDHRYTLISEAILAEKELRAPCFRLLFQPFFWAFIGRLVN